MMTPEEVRQQELSAQENPVDEVVVTSPADNISSPELDEVFVKSRIAEILGVALGEVSKYDLELKAIVDWAKANGKATNEDVFWNVRSLMNRVGSPGYGENGVRHLYQYVYLLNESKQVQKKLESMEIK